MLQVEMAVKGDTETEKKKPAKSFNTFICSSWQTIIPFTSTLLRYFLSRVRIFVGKHVGRSCWLSVQHVFQDKKNQKPNEKKKKQGTWKTHQKKSLCACLFVHHWVIAAKNWWSNVSKGHSYFNDSMEYILNRFLFTPTATDYWTFSKILSIV